MEMNNHVEQPARSVWLRRVWRYGPLALWLGFIFFASTDAFSASNTSRFIRPFLRWLLPGTAEERLAEIHGLIRKAAHFSEYAFLAWLTARAFVTSSIAWLRRYWFALALSLIALYALSDEYHQSFVPTRTSSIYDSLIDFSGGLVLLLLFALRQSWQRKPAPLAQEACDSQMVTD